MANLNRIRAAHENIKLDIRIAIGVYVRNEADDGNVFTPYLRTWAKRAVTDIIQASVDETGDTVIQQESVTFLTRFDERVAAGALLFPDGDGIGFTITTVSPESRRWMTVNAIRGTLEN